MSQLQEATGTLEAELAFSAVDLTPRSRPNVKISVTIIPGKAYLDTGVMTSVTSASLHAALQERNLRNHKQCIETASADGRKTTCVMHTYMLPVKLDGSTLLFVFVVLPRSNENYISLGCDFIEDFGAVIKVPQQYWYFIDEPERRRY